ncbi:MAG TPA: Fe-S cluster assembly protein SufD, partial [Bdellovibrionales bacterium]|nr:Fe-S cluster assembly protein SufD [Bdellovibrionales bacterium]
MASPVIDTSVINDAYSEFLASGAAFEEKAAGIARLREYRDLAAGVWRARGIPTRRDERWKYTDLSTLRQSIWAAADPLDAESLPSKSDFKWYSGEKSAEITLVNGRFVPSWSNTEVSGVRVMSAADLASNNAKDLPQLSQVLEKVIDTSSDDVFEALNTSFMNDVVIIEVAAGTVLKSPIIINTFAKTTDSLSEIAVVSPRIVLRIGTRAEASVVENASGNGRYFSMGMTDILVSASARLTHVRLNRENENSIHIGSTQISQLRDSRCETFQFTLGGALSRENLAIRLSETGAEAVLDGLYLADGKHHVDHFTSVDHIAPHTTSAQLYKGILNGEARAVFNGRVHIHRDAQKSNAAQMNNNLLLSSKAEVDTKPELEIDADDVKASHGATIGQIDPEHVFYLRARAVPKEQAVRMLSHGFAADVAFRIGNESVRKTVGEIVS